ncbi:MAG: serine hydrolase domain-containing protein, partial [Sphingomonadaceae bacterium]
MAEVWQEQLDHFKSMIEQDIADGLFYGAAVRVARGGNVVFDETIGSADGEGEKPLKKDSVFSIFSMTKAFTNVLTLRAIEQGRFALTTRVSEVIPEFSGHPRETATFYHLLTHTSGWPGLWEAKPGGYQGDFDETLNDVIERVHGTLDPGLRCDYQHMINHTLMGEALRRTDPKKRNLRDIYREDLFEPLAMQDTAMGVRKDLQTRHVVPDMRGNVPAVNPGRTKPGPYGMFEEEDAVMPHVGCVSTADNVLRFAEMLRRGGELDGARILSPRTIERARQNQTGEMVNELYRWLALSNGAEGYPAYIGLGFSLKGEKFVHSQYGTLTGVGTFGNNGAGSTIFWVDPEVDATFVCLTAGVMDEWQNT